MFMLNNKSDILLSCLLWYSRYKTEVLTVLRSIMQVFVKDSVSAVKMYKKAFNA